MLFRSKRLKTSLYEDMKDGILTKEEYLELHEAYLKKAKEEMCIRDRNDIDETEQGRYCYCKSGVSK